ncbi:hypothetical protein SLEP1_g38628 [Rubroshorea leprosula]|uniref:50S ribosomal protein L15 n=1 Tax=Rubroshorea leprosula TaxID=152421 RepID=A0AAV5KXM7_9ROSI|nr:hypothetical protein SLEP1_g38628 [Rubroshorea leprosula]
MSMSSWAEPQIKVRGGKGKVLKRQLTAVKLTVRGGAKLLGL